METYLYLSLIPEALIYSQLPPDRFGKYLAIGDKKLTRGPAIFFSIDPAFTSDAFKMKTALDKCHPHPDGSPRRSSYVSVYNVLAQVPVSAIGALYLTTKDGLTLQLDPSSESPPERKGYHLYQEICPVYPKVASPLGPEEFARYVTNPDNPVFLPKLAFCELRLNGMATDPEKSSASNLPYKDLNHLRECLTSLDYKQDKMTKIVHRDLNKDLIYPVVDTGFFVGDQNDFKYYPFPSEDDLEGKHHLWWGSATSVSRF
ncbi:hypothetical protein G0Q06_01565 [Puniceicoccales bacterium CK1056]|uniref:Uncharacterized protein n=1 Tax=Oceanipulchritudo coccoides TaxID=2706888 RepID=A0A6B2LX84_9BACT|nr:hypothetical protein [Oceanipulchritudo coccoides]NDV61131.1 hypothetical protein [Oceanipulchritudo coccoides]